MVCANFDPLQLMREDLRNLLPYQPHDYPCSVKLDANENPYPFPAQAWAELSEELRRIKFSVYPDPLAEKLRNAVAEYAGVQAEQVMFGNGSDELIYYLAIAFGSGRKVVVAEPTFSMYGIQSRIVGAELINVPLNDDFTVNPAVMIMAARSTGAQLMFLCSPNNPTGNAIPLEVIEEILANTNAVIVVDQAYLEFGGEDCTVLLKKYPNLVILRTFSKAFGLAGLRIGYLLANAETVNALMRLKQPYNLNSFSQAAAYIALKYRAHFAEQWQKIKSERIRVFSALKETPGVTVYPSEANFLLFRTEQDCNMVHRQLIEQGILIRNMGDGMPGYLRVAIGTDSENNAFIQALKTICSNGVK